MKRQFASGSISLLDTLGFDLVFEVFQYLKVADVSMLALTSIFHNSISKNDKLWRYYYTRDFGTTFPLVPDLPPQHIYYMRSMSGFMNKDRVKTFNNMLNILQKAKGTINPIQVSYSYGIWIIDFDRIPGYTYLEDDRGLGIELAFTSNGWFRYRDYDNDQLCVYSSSEVVNQNLHITEMSHTRIISELDNRITYKWGEWTIISDIGCLYIINNTDSHQCITLSPFEHGFVFFPTDKNPSNMNNIITYPS